MSAKLIRIVVVLDVVGALATETLDGSIWLVDSHKSSGSTDEGTARLKTAVKKHDVLLWTAMPLEVEAFAAIDAIQIDPQVCSVVQKVYPSTNIRYWEGTILKDVGKAIVPYNLVIRLGSRQTGIALPGADLPGLIGRQEHAP